MTKQVKFDTIEVQVITKGANNVSIKVTLEFKGTILDFEKNMDMDDRFDLVDSITWLCDYGTKEDPSTYHNKIKITASEETFDTPYKEKEDEQN